MQFSIIEFFYVVLAITRFTLDTRQNVLARPLGLVGNCLSIYIYYSTGLYAKCLQKGIFIVLNIYGWYQWLYGGKNKAPLKISTTSPRQLVISAVWILSVAWVLGKMLAFYSSATFPYWDSLPTVMVLMGQWMLMRKKLEAWLLFVPADILYTTLLYFNGLYLLSGLHFFYTILAMNGYRTWRQSYEQEKSLDAASATS